MPHVEVAGSPLASHPGWVPAKASSVSCSVRQRGVEPRIRAYQTRPFTGWVLAGDLAQADYTFAVESCAQVVDGSGPSRIVGRPGATRVVVAGGLEPPAASVSRRGHAWLATRTYFP